MLQKCRPYQNLTFEFPTISNNNIADTQTCTVRATLCDSLDPEMMNSRICTLCCSNIFVECKV